MKYIIYNTIDEEDFARLHIRISHLRHKFKLFLSRYGFEIANEADFADILGIDFISHGPKYNGNIGFMFDDKNIGQHIFTFYVTKSYDTNGVRYLNRLNLAEGVDLTYIENSWHELLEKAVKLYDSLKDGDLQKAVPLA